MFGTTKDFSQWNKSRRFVVDQTKCENHCSKSALVTDNYGTQHDLGKTHLTHFAYIIKLHVHSETSRNIAGSTRTHVRGAGAGRRATGAGGGVAFQRLSVAGIHVTGVPLDDLERAASSLIDALTLRREYMDVSYQEYPNILDYYLTHHQAPPKPDLQEEVVDLTQAVLKFDGLLHLITNFYTRRINPYFLPTTG
ncbi:uncharacterized protein LOC128199290 [Bicyclus anynana]|uniref:Uncharacterized protein LOC128199290 n=1 Tax=Bicyclus anynana TaxID=110368 RepID=A0ABM3LYL0_BICAN|nr:uncharacterized protein LOC128199290 [Bicyclus anynana]